MDGDDLAKIIFILILVAVPAGRAILQLLFKERRPDGSGRPAPPPIRKILEEMHREAEAGRPRPVRPAAPAERAREAADLEPAIRDDAVGVPPRPARGGAPAGPRWERIDEPPVLEPVGRGPQGPPARRQPPLPGRPVGRPVPRAPQRAGGARGAAAESGAPRGRPAPGRPRARPEATGDRAAAPHFRRIDPEADLDLRRPRHVLGTLRSLPAAADRTSLRRRGGLRKLGHLEISLRDAILAQTILGPPRGVEGYAPPGPERPR